MSELVNAFKNSATGTVIRALITIIIDYWPIFAVSYATYFFGHRDGVLNKHDNMGFIITLSTMVSMSVAQYLQSREYKKGSEESLDLKKENIRLQLQLDKAQIRIDSLELNNKLSKI